MWDCHTGLAVLNVWRECLRTLQELFYIMSYELTILSFAQTGLSSSEKSILNVLAFRANDACECWPSIKSIASDTSLDKKTVQSSLISLLNKKIISKTGRMEGRTKQIPVFKLHLLNDPKNGYGKKSNDPVFSGNDPKNGIAKRSQKRDTELKDLNDHMNVLAHALKNQKPKKSKHRKPTIQEQQDYYHKVPGTEWVGEYRRDMGFE